MKKRNKSINVFGFVFLFLSFLFAPVSLVMAYEAGAEKTTYEAAAEKTTYEAAKDAEKKKVEEEPDCE